MKKIFLSIVSFMMSIYLSFAFVGCGIVPKGEGGIPSLPFYEERDFVFFGFWSPYEFTEESFNLYKQSGLNTMFFGNHSVNDWSSDTLHYLGSNATMKFLTLCRKVGLNALLNYGSWYREGVEGSAYGNTPFSDYDVYGEYKDIIVGVHIADEPSLSKMSEIGNDTLTADFKSVYDVPYMVNLNPNYASESTIGSEGYKNYVETYAREIVEDFENNRLMSVDFYPFHTENINAGWLSCYNTIANIAKEINSKKSYYIQTAVGGSEFKNNLTIKDIRMQLNVAMTFGADWFGFYCYEVPRTYHDNGLYDARYDYCMLNPDGTPSVVYYSVQSEISRISAFSNVYLSYEWNKTVPVVKEGERGSYPLRSLGNVDFSGTEIKNVVSSEETIVGCFDSNQGEAFMFLNYENPKDDLTSDISIEFYDAEYVAVYGLKDEPEILKTEKGKLKLSLESGEGCFVTILK